MIQAAFVVSSMILCLRIHGDLNYSIADSVSAPSMVGMRDFTGQKTSGWRRSYSAKRLISQHLFTAHWKETRR